MRVYQQVLDMGGGAFDRLENIVGCDLDEAFATLSGRAVSGPKPDPAHRMASRGGLGGPVSEEPKAVISRRFAEAADGIRTHDLLHGKQTL